MQKQTALALAAHPAVSALRAVSTSRRKRQPHRRSPVHGLQSTPTTSTAVDFDEHLERLSPVCNDWQLCMHLRKTCLAADAAAHTGPAVPRLMRYISDQAATTYRDPALALALLRHVELRSPLSLFTASHIDIYVWKLRSLWETWHDIGACAECVDDMLSSGLVADERIRSLVAEIEAAVAADDAHDTGATRLAWRNAWDDELSTSLVAEAESETSSRRFGDIDRADLGRLVGLIQDNGVSPVA